MGTQSQNKPKQTQTNPIYRGEALYEAGMAKPDQIPAFGGL
jgi:hypothetical protein